MNWTKNQIEAINDESGSLAITAGAGSGKTSVLTERAAKLVSSGRARLDEILAITFTEKAATELKGRLAGIIKDPIAISSAYVGTFHAFCSRMLREHAPLINLDPDFSINAAPTSGIIIRKTVKETILKLLEEKDEMAELLIEELDFKDAIPCLEEMMEYRWHAGEIKKTKGKKQITNGREEKLREAAVACFRKVEEKYTALKGINLDFQDLEIYALKLLSIKDVQKEYRKRFKHIFVDEFQDINDTQAQIITSLHSPDHNSLTVVGDVKQSIYRFRGANPHQFEKEISQSKKTVSLAENHRSRPQILSFVNQCFPEFEGLIPSRAESGPAIHKIKIDADAKAKTDERRMMEAEKMAMIVPGLGGKTACLFQSLNSSRIYTSIFAERGIPYIIYGGLGFLELQEIADIINLLKVMDDPTNPVPLLAVARSPYIGLSDEELYLLCRPHPEGLFERMKAHPKGEFLRMTEKMADHVSISELVRSFTGVPREFHRSSIGVSREFHRSSIGVSREFHRSSIGVSRKFQMNSNVEKLIEIAREAEESEKITLGNFIEYLDSLKKKGAKIAEFPSMDDNALMLMTVHQAKGLEFDNVFLADTIRQTNHRSNKWCFLRGEDSELAFKLKPPDNPLADPMPSEYYEQLVVKDKEEDDAESRRLLYVAMTRAKENLFVPIHEGITKDGRWHKWLAKI